MTAKNRTLTNRPTRKLIVQLFTQVLVSAVIIAGRYSGFEGEMNEANLASTIELVVELLVVNLFGGFAGYFARPSPKDGVTSEYD